MIAPSHHKNGVGCKKCYFDSQKISKKEFVWRSKEFFGNKYDYSLFDELPPVGGKVQIKCIEHNEIFLQEPRNHIRGHTGCPNCRSNLLTGSGELLGSFTSQAELNTSFILKAQEVHGTEYDYKDFVYINNNTPSKITCPIHGEFLQTPSNHLKGTKCPKCAIKKKKENTFKKTCNDRGVNYCRALKRRQARLTEDQIFNEGYIRSERLINEIKIHNETFPNIEEAIRILKPPASSKTIARWIKEGISAEEAFEKIPNPGYADGIIYLITNKITKLQYVGLTVQLLERRWQYHIEHAYAGNIKSEDSLHAAIRKYGADNFNKREIDNGTTKKDLERKEKAWIEKLNTLVPNGYNISKGGVSGGSNKKPTTVDNIRFNSVSDAADHVAETRNISISAAKRRIRKGRIDVKSPALPGQSLIHTKTYKAWSRIIHGVLNPTSKEYIPDIDIYEKWKIFENFYNDVGEPINDKTVFARKDKERGFHPDNWAWMTKSDASKIAAQCLNKKKNIN